jgi:hypothetical protein
MDCAVLAGGATGFHAGSGSSAAPMSSGSMPNSAALQQFSACFLIEAHDEWQVSDR